MRVLLNVQSLAPPLTGVGRYTLEIVRALAADRRIERLECFDLFRWTSPERAIEKAASAGGTAASTGSANRGGLRRLLRDVPGSYSLRCAMRDLSFRLRAGSSQTFVYHEPNYILRPFAGPRVLTVHDISHLRCPQFHPNERVRHLEKRLSRSLEQADQIITVSSFSKKEMVDGLGIPEEKITPIPLGVSPAYRPRKAEETAPLLHGLGLKHGGYLLAVGAVEPRKNLPRLVRAFAELPETIKNRFPLAIAGAPGWGPPLDAPGLSALEAKGQIRRLGYVSDPALSFLYAGAGAFAFPSLYEGFGLPPLEALASGIPVLTSSAASLPEVVGDAALLVDPEDTKAIAEGLLRLLTDDTFRSRAPHAGPNQAAPFTWTSCAEKTIEVYARALR